MSNRLQYETSPYLLQHADNPVNWYPWSEEAFTRAKEEDKPIFLSIGYSTCHWCHVMEHESFEDEEIASLLNRYFIAIKVDKEERPDIDSIYMSVCQAFTGSGGWPTSIFMTAEQKPFFAGTYFPKRVRGGLIGFFELLTVIHEKWNTERDELLRQSEYVLEKLREIPLKNHAINTNPDRSAVLFFEQIFDRENGGFGNAPKFPMPHNLLFLMHYHDRYQDKNSLAMAEYTLMQMYRGGIFDHIGYGFCRYSTDERFLVPHFEKMLYDNALLILAYCKAYRCTKKMLYLDIAKKTAEYILREMTSSDGGFYSAQDADSEGEEGKYYLFEEKEIIALLGKTDGDAFNREYDITQRGNFEGKNIPNLLKSKVGDHSFESCLSRLLEYRKKRSMLHLDDKILTSWNSLMIAAMCELYRVSGNKEYLDAAKHADAFIQKNLFDGEYLYVSFRAEKRGVHGFLDDYASYIFAQLALYGATLEKDYLNRATTFFEKAWEHFHDINGGFYLYSHKNEPLILHPKETYDGAIPSGNSLMAYNLVCLSQLIPDRRYTDAAKQQMDFLGAEASDYPSGYTMFLLANLMYHEPPMKITVVLADPADKERLPIFIPSDAVIVLLEEGTASYPLINGKTTFYVCREHACLAPTNDLNFLRISS